MRDVQTNAPNNANSGPVTRRALVKASLGLGFCAAILPVWAQTIATPSDGLDAGEARVDAGDAEKARSRGKCAFPAGVAARAGRDRKGSST